MIYSHMSFVIHICEFGEIVSSDFRKRERLNLLADIAEMYFIDGLNQAEIARNVGMTRSNVSRMLTEARNTGIVHIQINRPIRENLTLAQQLIERFNLRNARVVEVNHSSQLLSKLGHIAGEELSTRLKPGWVLGTSWGTAISATVDEFEPEQPLQEIKVVQLLGAFGARIKDYDGHSVVHRLETKLDGEGIYLNSPFLVENSDVAQAFLENKSIRESLGYAKQADIALLGVGSIDINHSSYFLANYVTKNELLSIQRTGAVGDVCGCFFNINGKICAEDFQQRFIGINIDDLLAIPIRIGIAGGPAKIDPIIGALRGGLINILVSDEASIKEVLRRAEY